MCHEGYGGGPRLWFVSILLCKKWHLEGRNGIICYPRQKEATVPQFRHLNLYIKAARLHFQAFTDSAYCAQNGGGGCRGAIVAYISPEIGNVTPGQASINSFDLDSLRNSSILILFCPFCQFFNFLYPLAIYCNMYTHQVLTGLN